ncbi:myo-inosose-2 dehydratase [Neptunomonas phycophila]|jgi:inosose dehydratase|uniref:Myo-inosose-2 dehydratase n=1 Tax=Neptunomonas phycophila TaxID=1572645 RepID=A0ABT9EPQ0_9GAMM|nr:MULTISPECIES: myo-inosose-2 dehydratase [Neptunomonas]MDN2659532.1 myo-inosose-2 dehydratase [Neptunomonas sp. CHC150]MDP2521044.1 myo-inosose-2 dehydratase [Neptunomonas phycophila]
MSVRIGINPLSWTNDDLPTLGAETPLEVCLSEGKQAGFSGFELGNKFPRQPEVLGPILDSHQLDLVSGWFSGELLTRSVEEEIEAIEDHLHLLKTLGAKVMVYCEVTGCIHGQQGTPLSHRPRISEAEIAALGEKLTRVAEYTLSQGVQIAYHHHMGTVIESEAEVDLLMKYTSPAVGLLLDTGHLTFAGGDPIAVQKRHADRIVHVHCKDLREAVLKDAKNRDLSFLDAMLNGVFTVPGDGFIDYLSIFNGLKASNYQGWLVVEAEQDPAVAHPLTYATLGANNLKKFCAESGLNLVD